MEKEAIKEEPEEVADSRREDENIDMSTMIDDDDEIQKPR